MGEAFDSACKELRDSGQPSIVYEVIAKRIIDATWSGERDPVRLRNVGLAALGQPGRRQAGELGGRGRLRLDWNFRNSVSLPTAMTPAILSLRKH